MGATWNHLTFLVTLQNLDVLENIEVLAGKEEQGGEIPGSEDTWEVEEKETEEQVETIDEWAPCL